MERECPLSESVDRCVGGLQEDVSAGDRAGWDRLGLDSHGARAAAGQLAVQGLVLEGRLVITWWLDMG